MKRMVVGACALLAASVLFAGNVCTWKGLKGDGKWSSPENWDTPPTVDGGDAVVLSSSTADAVIVNDMGPVTLSRLQIASDSQSFRLEGGALTLSSTGGGDATAVSASTAAFYCAATAPVEVVTPIVLPLGNHYFYTAQNTDVTISGSISGAGKLMKMLDWTWSNVNSRFVLAGDNTHTGGTSLRSGNNVIASLTALGPKGSDVTFCGNQWKNEFVAEGDYDYSFSDDSTQNNVYLKIGANCRFLRNYVSIAASSTLTITAEEPFVADFLGDFTTTSGGAHYLRMSLGITKAGASEVHLRGHVYGWQITALDPGLYGGRVYLHTVGNTWYGNQIMSHSSNIHCKLEDALGGASVCPNFNWGHSAVYGQFDLEGHDQTVDRMLSYVSTYTPEQALGRAVTSATPATLTLKATADDVGYYAVNGKVNLVYDPVEPHTQTYRNWVSATSGSLTVLNGTIRIEGWASFKNASAIYVADGATFDLASEGVTAALAGLKEVTVEDGGTFRVAATAANPFPAGAIFNIASGARIELPGPQALDAYFFVDGEVATGRSFQPMNGDDPDAEKVPWLTGSGVLSVTCSDTSFWWGALKGGKWNTAANWGNGTVPTTGSAVRSDIGKDDFTIDVDAATATLGKLEVSRQGAGTTTLKVTTALSTDDTGVTGPAVTLGKGAKMTVPAGGTVTAASVDAYDNSTRYLLKDGARIEVDGGTFTASNFHGHFLLGDGTGDASVTNVLAVKSGTFNLTGRSSYDTWFRMDRDARLEITGGLAQFMSARFYDDKGGTIEVSGNGRLELGGIAAKEAFFSGVTRFSGNAQLSSMVGANMGAVYVVDAGAGTLLEFADHAGIDPTGKDTDGGYMFNAWRLQGSSADSDIRCHLYSDAVYQFGHSLQVGVNLGRAEVEMTNGFLRTHSSGLLIGTMVDQTLVDPAVEGVFKMSGGAAYVNASDSGNMKNHFYGLTVGDGSGEACARSSKRGLVRGRFELSGGVFTNDMWHTMTAFGVGNAIGEMIQTGGTFVRKDQPYFVLGMAGGDGRYVMSNGTYTASAAYDIWIGGASAADVNKTDVALPDRHDAKGLLRVWGGTFASPKATLKLGTDGTGRIEVGPTGRIEAANAVLADAGTGVAPNALRFEFDENGVGQLALSGKLTVGAGSKLEIDVGNYSARKSAYNLVTFDSIEGGFDATDITITGSEELLKVAKVKVSEHAIRVSMPRTGLVITVR